MDCVEKIDPDNHNCLPPCEGFHVTGYSKSHIIHDMGSLTNEYSKYKGSFTFPSGIKGLWMNYISKRWTCVNCLEYEWRNTLRIVRLYFDTPTFDRVTKDNAAKFTDILSAIGGTMGLLTGFSIISAVEILYFTLHICFKIFVKK